MHHCRSGRHVWMDKVNAERCCDPNWRRVLLVGREAFQGDSLPQHDGNWYGRKWLYVGAVA